MLKEILTKFEGQRVKIVLKNSFIYSNIFFQITEEGLVSFDDRNGEPILIEPEFVALVTKVNNNFKRGKK